MWVFEKPLPSYRKTHRSRRRALPSTPPLPFSPPRPGRAGNRRRARAGPEVRAWPEIAGKTATSYNGGHNHKIDI